MGRKWIAVALSLGLVSAPGLLHAGSPAAGNPRELWGTWRSPGGGPHLVLTIKGDDQAVLELDGKPVPDVKFGYAYADPPAGPMVSLYRKTADAWQYIYLIPGSDLKGGHPRLQGYYELHQAAPGTVGRTTIYPVELTKAP